MAVSTVLTRAEAAVWPDSALPATAESAVAISMGHAWGTTPPFFDEKRDVGRLGFSGRWAASHGVILTARYEALRAVFEDGTVVTGSGDLRLGTAARAWRGTQAAPEVWLWWEVKLPNASDFEGDDPRQNVYGLGSDETDVTLGAGLRWSWDPVTIDAIAGLAILGDPWSFANQDDAAVAVLVARAPLGPVELMGRVGGRLPSPDNNADVSLAAAAEWTPTQSAPGLRLGIQVQAGLTAAAPDLAASLWLGHRWGH